MPGRIVRYINAQLKAGYSLDAIRKVLYQQGYTPYQVSEAEKELHHPALKYWLIAGGVVAIITLLFLLWPESAIEQTQVLPNTIILEESEPVPCDAFGGIEREFCIAEEAETLDSCIALADPSLRDDCINTYTLRTGDFSGCKEIQNTALRLSCQDLKKSLET